MNPKHKTKGIKLINLEVIHKKKVMFMIILNHSSEI